MFGAARMCGAKSMDKEKFVKRNRMWGEFTLQSLCYVDLGEYEIARKCTFTITLCYLENIRIAWGIIYIWNLFIYSFLKTIKKQFRGETFKTNIIEQEFFSLCELNSLFIFNFRKIHSFLIKKLRNLKINFLIILQCSEKILVARNPRFEINQFFADSIFRKYFTTSQICQQFSMFTAHLLIFSGAT